jgi:FkbM family methyltransferase
MISSTKTRYRNNFSYYDNDQVIGQSLKLYGEYGQKEIEFLLWMANPSHVIYDVGANIGVYTSALASSGAKVYAFEPNPRNFALLKQNTAELTNVYRYQTAIGNAYGTTYIEDFDPQVPGNYGTMSTTNNHGIGVELMALDYLSIPDPTLIKVDVEGSELAVLLGCEKKIAKSLPCIVYEAHETEQFGDIWHFLKRFNYRLYWLVFTNYNSENFNKNTDNVFQNTALFSVVAWPPTWPDNLLPNLEEVTGPDDDWRKFEDRKFDDYK